MLIGTIRHGKAHREHVARAAWREKARSLAGCRVPLAAWLGRRVPTFVTILGPSYSVNHILTRYDGALDGDHQVREIDEVVLSEPNRVNPC